MTLNAEETSRSGCPVAAGANGSSSRGISPVRPPAPPTWEGLPPGPNTPLTMLAYWYRRNPFFEHCRTQYGSPFTLRLRIPAVPFVVISKPDQLKAMFHAPPDVLYAGDGSSELHKYFGSPGLAYMEEAEHLVRRKLINRSTHGEAMKQISTAVQNVIQHELDSWPKDTLIELFPRFHRLAVSVVRYVNFGPEDDPRLDELVDVVCEILASANTPVSMVEDQYLPPSVVNVMKAVRPIGYRRILELCARADKLIYSVMQDRRREGVAEDRYDTVSMLLNTPNEDGSPMDLVEIRNEVMTNFIAGSATTGTAMAWAIEHIAKDHAVRERLLAEIDGDADEDDPYLTATVTEILRRKPPLPQVIPRLVVKPFELGGWTLPPGVRVLASAYLVHHDPEIYPDPYAFRPERFLDEGPGIYTWIPFGGGRRKCLGKGIAELEIKEVIRGIFKRFEVRPDAPDSEANRPFMVILRPSRGARVSLSERH